MRRALIALFVLALAAFAANIKLYLKDGGFHLVREYRVETDHVRYYSVERSEWKEMPLDLVDLKRTESELAERQTQLTAETKVVAEEEKAVHEARAEAANRYRASLVAHVSDAILGIDAEGRIESWNEAARAIYGWTEVEVAGLSIAAVVTANRTDSAAVLERGQRSHHRKDGSEVDVLVSIDPLIDDDTQPSGWVVVCTELTDARQAEAGRRAAEERYEAVVASLSEGIVLFDESGNICALNEAATRILGDRLESGSGHQIFTGSSIAIDADGQPLSADMFPHEQTLATNESLDDVIIGVSDGNGRRQWLSDRKSTRLNSSHLGI